MYIPGHHSDSGLGIGRFLSEFINMKKPGKKIIIFIFILEFYILYQYKVEINIYSVRKTDSNVLFLKIKAYQNVFIYYMYYQLNQGFAVNSICLYKGLWKSKSVIFLIQFINKALLRRHDALSFYILNIIQLKKLEFVF